MGMNREIKDQRQRLGDADGHLKAFRNDLHETIQHIQDPKLLKESVKRLYQRHVTEHSSSRELEADIQKEYNRQRDYLEKSVESLKRKLNKNMELHRSDNQRMMQENVSLIKEINELRREIKNMKQAQRAKELAGGNAKKPAGRSGKEPTNLNEAAREIEMQK